MPAEIWPCPRHAHCALSSPKGTRWGPSEVQHWQSNTIAVHVLEKKNTKKRCGSCPPPSSIVVLLLTLEARLTFLLLLCEWKHSKAKGPPGPC